MKYTIWIIIFTITLISVDSSIAQTAMINVESRNLTSLNGNWNAIIDPTEIGEWRQVWLEKTPGKKTDFFEYSFQGAPELKVPGDFNSQKCELTYFEGTVWYKKQFDYTIKKGKRLFLHYGAVNYIADVYLNGKKIGTHEGGFTPFQFEITDKILTGINRIIVKVNNNRQGNGLPSYGYDWLNYGGITRGVNLIETNNTYILDYSVQLKKGSLEEIFGWVQLDGIQSEQNIKVKIPELNIVFQTKSDKNGLANIELTSNFELWSPQNPKLYQVLIESETDTINDIIGFRCIEVDENKTIIINKNND